jgi:putative ABC transport system ATP-binding protein
MNDATAPAIETRHLTRTFEDSGVRAVDDVSFQIAPQEWVALTGPSGSGKSTLLHLLGALDEPTSGDIIINGRNLRAYGNLDHYRSHEVGLVFQLHNLLPNLSALQNVQVAMVGTGVGRSESAARAHELLESVGLAARVKLRPPALSGGERQRVAIARALANGPSILLADEPTGALDAAAAESVMDLFNRIRSQRKLTILLVTHDPVVAACADRVIHLKDGRLVIDGEIVPAARALRPEMHGANQPDPADAARRPGGGGAAE